jgi:hypothetical protein
MDRGSGLQGGENWIYHPLSVEITPEVGVLAELRLLFSLLSFIGRTYALTG